MIRQIAAISVVVSLGFIAGCSSGGGGPTCSYATPPGLTTSSWPKFRHDLQNTGAINGVTLSSNLSISQAFSSASKQPIVASPVLGNGAPSDNRPDQRLYAASTDGNIYALDSDTLQQLPSTAFTFSTAGAFVGTPFVALRADQEALFVGATNAFLYGIDQSGGNLPNYWPLTLGSSIEASPTINGVDGTVYVGTFANALYATCPNAVNRFSGVSSGPINSSPAVSAEELILVGSSDRQLRGFGTNGFRMFSVTMAGSLANAPVIEVDSTKSPPASVAFYAVDAVGSLLKVNPNGQTMAPYPVQLPATVTRSSPALAGDHLYVGTDDGQLLAINTSDGSIAWSFDTSAGNFMLTSPAVAVDGESRTVVVASVDGRLQVVDDLGDSFQLVTTIALGATTQSSPAIRDDGTVYIADDEGRVLMLE